METESIINGLLYTMLITNVSDKCLIFIILYETEYVTYYAIWYRKLYFIRNNQSLLIGTIIGYKQSSERAIEDLTYTPLSDSKFCP